MKKLFLAFFMAVATVSFLTGCDKEDEDELTDGTEQTDGTDSTDGEQPGDDTVEPVVNPMVGVWECTSGYTGPGSWVLTLNEDGTFTEVFYGDDLEGTWSYDEETAVLTMVEKGYENWPNEYTVKDFTGTTMTLDEGWTHYDFVKK